MDDLSRVALNIIDSIPIPPTQMYLILTSENKEQFGLAIQSLLSSRGFETHLVRLNSKIAQGQPIFQDLVNQVVRSNSGIISLLQPEHASFLFETFGRPDLGFKQPMKYIYNDWLMPVETMRRTMSANFTELAEFKNRLLSQVKNAREINIITTKGTNITLYPRNWMESKGEVFCTPFEERTYGKIFVDGCAYWGPPKTPFTLWINEGRVINTKEIETDDLQHQNVLKDLNRDVNSNIVSELGIGINPNALWNEHLMESEQARGTCHFGFGHNKNYGGTVESKYHFDLVIQKPTITLDSNVICMDGVFLK